MKRTDLVIGETYLVSSSNDWIDTAYRNERVMLLSDQPFEYSNRGSARFIRTEAPAPLDTVADITDQAPEGFDTVEVVRGTKPSRDGWKQPGVSSIVYTERVGALMVAVDEHGRPSGLAGVRRLRDIRDTYENGSAAIRAASRARTQAERARREAERARRETERSHADRLDAAKAKAGSGEYAVTMYQGQVRMSLAEYERIVALIPLTA